MTDDIFTINQNILNNVLISDDDTADFSGDDSIDEFDPLEDLEDEDDQDSVEEDSYDDNDDF